MVYYSSASSPRLVKSGESVDKNTTLSIKVTPEDGYEVTHYIVNGEEKPTTSNSVNEVKVEEDMTISAKVVQANSCTVTITQPIEGGTLRVMNMNTFQLLTSGDKVDSGTQIMMAVTPDDGYVIDCWLIDGKDIEPSKNQPTSYSYIVNKNVTISVKLKSKAPASGYLVTYEQPEGGTLTVKSGYPLAVVKKVLHWISALL